MIKIDFTRQLELAMIQLYNHNVHKPDDYFKVWMEEKFNCGIDPFWLTITSNHDNDYNWFLLHV